MMMRPALLPEGSDDAALGARYQVRDPYTKALLAEAGEDKPMDAYWVRRMLEGSVEFMAAPASGEEAAP